MNLISTTLTCCCICCIPVVRNDSVSPINNCRRLCDCHIASVHYNINIRLASNIRDVANSDLDRLAILHGIISLLTCHVPTNDRSTSSILCCSCVSIMLHRAIILCGGSEFCVSIINSILVCLRVGYLMLCTNLLQCVLLELLGSRIVWCVACLELLTSHANHVVEVILCLDPCRLVRP